MEIQKYKSTIKDRAKLDEISYQLTWKLLFSEIQLIPRKLIRTFVDQANNIIGSKDPKDMLYVATYLCLEGVDSIWTNDPDFSKLPEINILSTPELIERMN